MRKSKSAENVPDLIRGRYEKSLQNCEKQKIGTFNIVRVQRKSTENLRYKDIKSRNIRELSVSDSQSIFGFL